MFCQGIKICHLIICLFKYFPVVEKSSQKVYNLNVDRGKNICYTINGIKANKNPNGIFRGNGRFYENEVSPMAIEAAF